MPATTRRERQNDERSALLKAYRWMSPICLWAGFLWPFAVSRFVGMPFSRHLSAAVGGVLLWALGMALGYLLFARDAAVSAAPLWVRVSRYVTATPATSIMLAVALGFLYYPSVENTFVARRINVWLTITLLVMGVQITAADWKAIFRHPKIISAAVVLRWLFMPLIAYFLAYGFLVKLVNPQAATALAVGMVIVGTTPTGSASNTLTLISQGDLALSVSVTSVNTLLAPFLQPLLIKLFVGRATHVNSVGIFTDLVEAVLIPVLIGSLVGSRYPEQVKRLKPLLGAISVICLGLMMVATVSKGTGTLLKHVWVLPVLGVAVILHALAGLAIGYYLPKWIGFSNKQRVASSFEVGVGNAALGVFVALNHFSPLAAIPGVLSGKLQNMLAIGIFVPRFQKLTSAVETVPPVRAKLSKVAAGGAEEVAS
jgi:BASS family bile acid:Na+ symporter